MILDESPVKARQRQRIEAKRQRISARERFKRAHRAEKSFAVQMRAVARQVDQIVKGFTPKGEVVNWPMLNSALGRYADMLRPWAKAVSEKLIAEVGNRDERAWTEMGRDIGRNLRAEIRTAPTGEVMKSIMEEQVDLITSLPLDAAKRVHELTQQALSGGERAREAQEEILRTGEVTKSRAMLIARTETTRTATAMTEARAVHIGSEGYIWRTARDADVRHQHKKLEGKFFKWSNPPITGPSGERSHPGAIYNCRCYPEVVIPENL